MPSSVLSHQAPALLIKLKYPNRFDGTALCISTFIPDIDVIIDFFLPFSIRGITHSLLGLILWTIPLTIILTIVFSRYIGPLSAKIVKKKKIFKSLRYFGIDEWTNLKNKRFNHRFFVVAFYSALIGGTTHLLLDLPSHALIYIFYPLIIQSPDFLLFAIKEGTTIYVGQNLIDTSLYVYRLIWLIETIVTLFLSLYLLRYIKKHKLITKWYKEKRLNHEINNHNL
ncbi:MAG: DUF4184 family protein [Candidatus Odinarchaeota archaeon]